MAFPLLIIFLVIYYIVAANKKAKEMQEARARAAKKAAKEPSRPQESSAEAVRKDTPAAAPAAQMLPDTRIEPAKVSVRISEHHHENMYAGSMNAEELEGNPDSFDQMPSEHSAELFVETEHQPEAPAEGVRLDFTPSALVNAVIMQEVLKRPKFRRP